MSENKSEIIDVRGYLSGYLKKWYWFVASVAVCVGFGLAVSTLIQPKYEVRANVLLTEQSTVSKFLGGGLSGVSQLFGGNSSAEDEVQIMTSHSVLRSVVSDLGLNTTVARRLMPLVYELETAEYPVVVTPDSSINLDTLRATLIFKIKTDPKGNANVNVKAKGKTIFSKGDIQLPATIVTDYGKFAVSTTEFLDPEEVTTVRVKITSPDIAAEDLRELINVSLASKHSQIVEMQMLTGNEEYAKNILNKLIENYNIRSRKDQDYQNGATARFIEERLAAVRNDLNRVETELARYKQGEGLGMVEADGTVMYERLAEAEKKLTEQQVLTEMARITLQLARESEKDNSLIPPMADNDGLSSLINAYNSMVLRRVSVESASKPDNMALQRIDDQIRLMRQNLVASLESALSSSKDVEAELRRVYDRARKQITGLPATEFNFRKIARDQAIEEEIYVFLLKKQEETNVLFNNQNPKAQIIDEAYSLNEDISLGTLEILLVCILLGMMIPPVCFYIIDHLKTGKRKESAN